MITLFKANEEVRQQIFWKFNITSKNDQENRLFRLIGKHAQRCQSLTKIQGCEQDVLSLHELSTNRLIRLQNHVVTNGTSPQDKFFLQEKTVYSKI